MTSDEFNKLIDRVKVFDEKAFKCIYDGYSRLILWIALQITKNNADALDVHSIVMIDIWNNARTYGYIVNPDDWISTITRNKAINYYNKNIKRHLKNVEYDFVSDAEMLSYLSSENNLSEVEFDSVIGCLNESEQRIVKLKVFYKFTHEEISKQLDIPLGTVLWKFNGAVKKLRAVLSEKNIS